MYTEPVKKKRDTSSQVPEERGKYEVLKAIILSMSLKYLKEAFSSKGVEMGAHNRERWKWDWLPQKRELIYEYDQGIC